MHQRDVHVLKNFVKNTISPRLDLSLQFRRKRTLSELGQVGTNREVELVELHMMRTAFREQFTAQICGSKGV